MLQKCNMNDSTHHTPSILTTQAYKSNVRWGLAGKSCRTVAEWTMDRPEASWKIRLYRCLNGANLKKIKKSTWNSRKFWTCFLILNRYLGNFWSSFCFLAPYILHSWSGTLECTPETIIYCSLIRKLYWWTQSTVTVQFRRLKITPLR